jgi:hypothetical protein
LADLAAAVLSDGQPRFEVVDAWRLEPEGRIDGYQVVLPGEVVIDPADPSCDIFAALRVSSIAVANDVSATPATRQLRKAAVKGGGVSACFGNLARVDRVPIAKPRDITVITPDGRLIEERTKVVIEEPGPDHFPPIPACVTAATRLLGTMVERRVTDAGSLLAQVLTDAFTIPATPSGGTLECRGGRVDVLSFNEIEAIRAEFAARLGVVVKVEHDSLERSLNAYVAGPNRYRFERDGKVIHNTEFALGGVYEDPSGRCDARLPDGRRFWVEEALTWATYESEGIEAVEPEWTGSWSVSRFRASTPSLAKWLGHDTRPFDQGLAVHEELFSQDRSSISGPVARALWSTSPDDWSHLDWHRRSGKAVSPLPPSWSPGYPYSADRFMPELIGTTARRWCSASGRVSRPVVGRESGLARGVMERLAVVALGDLVLVGREGDQLLERQRGIVSLLDAVTFYGDGDDLLWRMVIEVAELLGPTELGKVLRVPPARSHQYLVRRTPSEARRAKVVHSLRLHATRQLLEEGREVPEESLAILVAFAELLRERRRCQACGRALRGSQERWCSDACCDWERRHPGMRRPIAEENEETA